MTSKGVHAYSYKGEIMLVEIDRNYGADADGNRGMTAYFHDLEDSDFEWVYEQIAEQYDPNEKYYVVVGICPISEMDVEFEVSIKDWLTPEEILELDNLYNEEM